eukprot:TRINITY_DN5144_c0_g1_i1.p1 TRINITY_DN5144_c0_g1~~TRINITY_DN5144_c0_g1_i1.p1  ORF type:complete len:200 (+),score=69.50 TRINITY_DN5144_c0_g1_i1:162-761(+)
MPPRPSSPVSRDKKEHLDVMKRIKAGKVQRKADERLSQKDKEEEQEREKEWEDSMVTHLEYLFNGLVAFVAASLPASESPPDYVTAIVVVLFNILLNLMFRSTWVDRVILYVINLMLPASGEVIRRLDELPGKMPPIAWLVFISTNALLIALGYWYYVRKAARADNEWRQNILALGVIAINVAVGVATGVLRYATRWCV